ncbi:MAG: FmdB family transcriptional regulator [Opitutaceae bacterium]|jgi:hypothetical protein|nr:FmdB family transcriptional regulator [Opitutaceae bacterium]
MPIYEYYCSQNHTVYQFYARSLAQGKLTPRCPDNPKWPLKRVVSQFAFTGRAKEPVAGDEQPASEGGPDDARMEAAMQAMEKEFDSVDENDPKAMARMMRRMSELTGEKIDGEMEEVVRKLEEGVDPEALEDRLGAGAGDEDSEGEYGEPGGAPRSEAEKKEARMRWRVRRATTAPRRDPQLYDYE